jgi:hypothetical protein
MSLSRDTLVWIYYFCALALVVAGAILWATGHGTGDPYLTLGVVLAVAPVVVNWLRRRFSRG